MVRNPTPEDREKSNARKRAKYAREQKVGRNTVYVLGEKYEPPYAGVWEEIQTLLSEAAGEKPGRENRRERARMRKYRSPYDY